MFSVHGDLAVMCKIGLAFIALVVYSYFEANGPFHCSPRKDGLKFMKCLFSSCSHFLPLPREKK